MKGILSSYKVVLDFAGLRFHFLTIMSLLSGLLDGIGLTMLLPLLESSEFKQGASNLPYLLQKFFDILGLNPEFSVVLLVIAVTFIIKLIAKVAEGYVQSKIVSDLITIWRRDLVSSYRDISYSFYLQGSSGHFTNVLNTQVNQSAEFVRNYSSFLSKLITCVVYIILALWMSPGFSSVALGLGLLVLASFRSIMRKTKAVSRALSIENSTVNRILIQIVHNFKYLRATARYELVQRKAENSIELLRQYRFRTGIYSTVTQSFQEPVPALIMISMIYYYVEIKGVSFAPLLVSLVLFYRTMNTVMIAQSIWQSALNDIGAIEILIREFSRINRNKDKGGATAAPINISGPMHFENVSFSYGESQVLSGLSFCIHPNSMVALVGPSGSGKTTVVDLITKLLMPTHGEIKIDGTKLDEVSAEEWQKHIGYVTQDAMVFDDSISNNISMWAKARSSSDSIDTQIREAARMANCLDFIEALPDRFETQIGERGVRLSGGQRQRLAIARELYHRPNILILDEATSALDAESEAKIQESILSLKGKMTVVVIAHRLSTIKDVDWVIVLDSGKLVEQGTYKELSKAESRLREMLAAQGMA